MAYDNDAPNMPKREVVARNDTKLKPPDTSQMEAFLAAAKAASQLIPFAGGSIAEAVGYFGQRYIDEQQNTFIEAVLSELDQIRIDLDRLNDSFFATFLHALEVARRTHEQAKREALKNAVVNTARPEALSDDLRHIFVNTVSDLTPLHMKLLEFILHPEKYGIDSGLYRKLQFLRGPGEEDLIWQVIGRAIPTANMPEVVLLCFSDLVNHFLLIYPGFGENKDLLVLPRPTGIAAQFMAFITEQETRVKD